MPKRDPYLIIVVVLILTLGGALLYKDRTEAPSGERASALDFNVVAPIDKLVDKFELSVFRSDYRGPDFLPNSKISKWTSPIHVRLNGEESERLKGHVAGTLVELSRLTDLPMRMVQESDGATANVDLFVEYLENIESLYRAQWLGPYMETNRKWGLCSGTAATNKEKEIFYSIIIFRKRLSDLMKRGCVIEEFTQSLGLYADSEIIETSVMNEKVRFTDFLPLNDKIMVRTLYDARLKPGMTRAEAMPIVRQIIPELVTAVKERGEAALYQY